MILFQPSKRMMFVQTLIRWELFDKRKEVYDQLKKGLNVLHFLDLTSDLQDFEHLFLCRNKDKTTADFIRKKLIPEVKKLTPQDKEEEDAQKFTLRCLEDLEGKSWSRLSWYKLIQYTFTFIHVQNPQKSNRPLRWENHKNCTCTCI